MTIIPSRRAVLAAHRWTGLTLGLFAVVMAVTGAGLALEPMLGAGNTARSGTCAVPVSLDRQMAAAQAADPAAAIVPTRLELRAGELTVFRFSDDQAVSVDPCTGAAISVQSRFAGVFGRLEQLHRLSYWHDSGFSKL